MPPLDERAGAVPLVAATDYTKVCPACAETVKAAAKVCRYCSHSFDEPEEGPATTA